MTLSHAMWCLQALYKMSGTTFMTGEPLCRQCLCQQWGCHGCEALSSFIAKPVMKWSQLWWDVIMRVVVPFEWPLLCGGHPGEVGTAFPLKSGCHILVMFGVDFKLEMDLWTVQNVHLFHPTLTRKYAFSTQVGLYRKEVSVLLNKAFCNIKQWHKGHLSGWTRWSYSTPLPWMVSGIMIWHLGPKEKKIFPEKPLMCLG